ncbi:hypothetical protein ACOI1H_20770 [Loktanella sp. DJP18]|uniref:hypothetical protein n=1 Tax=Loktanella sp. DJP18 TaxID=3409788 RepID=UPI003BB50DBF
MSTNIYAGKVKADTDGITYMGPVIDFDCWEPDMWAEDGGARADRGEDPYVPNPRYVPYAGMNLSNHNAEALCDLLGLTLDDGSMGDFPIDEVFTAAMRGRNGAAASYTEAGSVVTGTAGAAIHHGGIADGYMSGRISQLMALIATARPLGATHICVC